MPRRFSVKDARANFSDVLAMVDNGKETVIIEKQGRPLAVLISPEQWERYQQYLKDRFFEAVDQLQHRNAEVDPDEVEREVAAAVEEVRRERHAKR